MSTFSSAWRSIFHHPLYVTLSTVTLGLGIGVCVSNFATVDALVLRPLLLPDLDRLVMVGSQRYRYVASSMAVVGGLALLLSAVGLYSVMAFFVTERTHEIGIRMAMGAAAGNVVSHVVAHGLKLAGIGLAIGLALAVLVVRAMASLLFGVTATDVVSLSVAVLVLLASALLACWIPARRAASVDPMTALRHR